MRGWGAGGRVGRRGIQNQRLVMAVVMISKGEAFTAHLHALLHPAPTRTPPASCTPLPTHPPLPFTHKNTPFPAPTTHPTHLSRAPELPVRFTRSHPARSTKWR